MRKICASFLILFTLAACDDMVNNDISHYKNDPDKRTVQVDEFKIYVAPAGWHTYVAWGGVEGKDGTQIQYRQRRAIELVSKCRVSKITSHKGDELLRAVVKC